MPQENHVTTEKFDGISIYKVGKIKDAHGIKGEVFVLLFSGEASWLNSVQFLYLKKRSGFEKIQILKAKLHKGGLICHLQGFDDRNKAEYYAGLEVWIDERVLVSNDGEALYLKEILGFKIHDEIKGLVGEVHHFSSNGVQDILIVKDTKNSEADIEIPFVKEFVKQIDFNNKVIQMLLPEGLLSINSTDE